MLRNGAAQVTEKITMLRNSTAQAIEKTNHAEEWYSTK